MGRQTRLRWIQAKKRAYVVGAIIVIVAGVLLYVIYRLS